MCSAEFKDFLEFFAGYYERRIHAFTDIVIDNTVIYGRDQLKAMFLENRKHMTVESRLNRLWQRVCQHAEPYYKSVYDKYKPLVYDNPKYTFEEDRRIDKAIAKYRANFERKYKKQFKLRIIDIYKEMINCRHILPPNAEKHLHTVETSLARGVLPFYAAVGALYLKLLLCGTPIRKGKETYKIKHVIIDEAQDYFELHYHLFNKLFPDASFTVLRDLNQTVIGSDRKSTRLNSSH